jgi:hypothetical protein
MVNANECYVTNADMKENLAYGTCGEMETTTPSQHIIQNQVSNIPAEPNQCYGIATPPVDPDQLYATVEGEDMKLSQNEAYTATSILVDPNQCYGIGTDNVDTPIPTIGDYVDCQ